MQLRTIPMGLLAAGAFCALASGAQAQNGNATPYISTLGQKKLSATDRKFMDAAAAGGLAEVQLGQIAARKGVSDGVRGFGQRMVEDHTAANSQLKLLAQNKGYNLPVSTMPKDQKIQARLSQMSGKAFDHAYVTDMIADHREDIAEFTKEAKNGKDPDIRKFAATTLPTLQMHYDMARQLNGKSPYPTRGTKMGRSGKMKGTGADAKVDYNGAENIQRP